MPELLEEQRESWGTRGGFILAAVGSAVGLGNLWGFPYKLYSYGGGAFLIPYIIALFLIGIPLMVLEFSLGHYTQRAAPDAFKQAHRRFELVGWWGTLMGFVVIVYYTILLAYCFSFLWYSIVGIFNGGKLPWSGEGLEGVANAKNFFFQEYLNYQEGPKLGPVQWKIVWPLFLTWVAMYLCIFRGVRLVGKIVWLTVPLPWLMLLILAVRGLTLEGSMQGLAYYLDPVWSELAKPVTWRFAFGQVFFSLSLAWGVMITYASFLHRKSDINNNAAVVSLADFATSFVAGLAVFATLGGMAFVTQQAGDFVPVEQVAEKGPSLAFVAFPYTLAQLPYSAWFSFIFFFALVTLGIDSAFSITEAVLASIVDKTGWRRDIVLPGISVVGLLLGLFFVTRGGLYWLGTIDGFANGTWGIAFMGLLECLVLGWLWRVGILRRHANSRSDWNLGRWWDYLIRIVVPVLLGTLFFWQLFDDLTAEGGFLRTPEGEWILSNCVGLGVILTVPVFAVIFTLARGRTGIKEPERVEQNLDIRDTYTFQRMSLGKILFSLKGRISRSDYWYRGILLLHIVRFQVLLMIYLVQEFIYRVPETTFLVTIYFVYIIAFWAGLAINLKRLHDLNRSILFFLILFVPLVGPIWFLIEVGFIKGTDGTNRFGPDPLSTRRLLDKSAQAFRSGRFAAKIALLFSLGSGVILVVTLITPIISEQFMWFLRFESLILAVAAITISSFILDEYGRSSSFSCWSARWAGILATMDVSAFIALILIGLTRTVKVDTETPVHHELTGVSYIILAFVFLIIVGGLGWCLYRAMTAAGKIDEQQSPEEVGDEQ